MRENASAATPVPRQHHPNVLPLEGDIDLHVSPLVRESLNAMIKKKPERIVIDLTVPVVILAVVPSLRLEPKPGPVRCRFSVSVLVGYQFRFSFSSKCGTDPGDWT